MDEDMQTDVAVRLDTAGFRRDVGDMRQALEGAMGMAGDRGARAIEQALARAMRQGRLGFDDLAGAALSAVDRIAAGAVRAGVREASTGAGVGGGLGQVLGGLAAAVLGLPGRATGGPVAPGRAYLVGERGPELFVPTAAGRVEPGTAAPARDVRVAITIQAPPGETAGALRQSGRQVARAVRAALLEE